MTRLLRVISQLIGYLVIIGLVGVLMMFAGVWFTEQYHWEWFGYRPVSAATVPAPATASASIDADALAKKVVAAMPSVAAPLSAEQIVAAVQRAIPACSAPPACPSFPVIPSCPSCPSMSCPAVEEAPSCKAALAELLELRREVRSPASLPEPPPAKRESLSPPSSPCGRSEEARAEPEWKCPNPGIVRTRPDMLGTCLDEFQERRAKASAELRQAQDAVRFLDGISTAYKRKPY